VSGVDQIVLFFLGASLLFYVLFGGADFGAGILELFLARTERDAQRGLIARAMAPVWEANHVWLILVVVILFVGFPTVYTTVSIHLHLPLVALLLGITARGCAFTFRHYDTVTTEYHRVYTAVFAASSLATSFVLGVLAGAAGLGRIDPAAPTYHAAYIAPWLNWYCAAMGVFVCCLFALLAAIFLAGEAPAGPLRRIFLRRAVAANVAVVLAGAAVFGAAQWEGLPLLFSFFRNPVSIGCFLVATVLLVPFWRLLHGEGRLLYVRFLGAAIVTLVLIGWYAVQYPIVVRLRAGAILFAEAAAPAATMHALAWALVVGSLLIFPALGYLLAVFKGESLMRRDPRL
jgi:cytochrome d ubiquinol oxidase subunit II